MSPNQGCTDDNQKMYLYLKSEKFKLNCQFGTTDLYTLLK